MDLKILLENLEKELADNKGYLEQVEKNNNFTSVKQWENRTSTLRRNINTVQREILQVKRMIKEN